MPKQIALDAMGGDHAPEEIVAGAVAVAERRSDVQLFLVGDSSRIKTLLPNPAPQNIVLVHASDVIGMAESPVPAVRGKPNSSINVGMYLVKEGKAQAFISAGNTGAVMAAALFILGRIEGVERPAITGVLPTRTGKVILLDLGANVDCKPRQLVQFAQMGSLFAKVFLQIAHPRVALLNIGEEPEKGNELVLAAHEMLVNQKDVFFVGNVEGTHVYSGQVDVVVCDGFSGNIVLKLSEGVVETVLSFLKNEIMSSTRAKLGALLLKPIFKRLRKKIDYDEFGGAMLLGVNGGVVISHGRAKRQAIQSAISRAAEMIEGNMVKRIHDQVLKHQVALADA
jgi:glycerol-3-phosphate acyltransferase PlsX